MTPYTPKNTLQQDLFLACKGKYSNDNKLSRIDAARIVCAIHILSRPKDFPMDSLVHWLLEEFIYKGVIILNVRQFGEMVLDSVDRYMNKDLAYYERLATVIANRIYRLKVRGDDDSNLLPFPIPEVDAQMLHFVAEWNPEQEA